MTSAGGIWQNELFIPVIAAWSKCPLITFQPEHSIYHVKLIINWYEYFHFEQTVTTAEMLFN